MSDALLIFRGEVAELGNEEILVDAMSRGAAGPRLCISGGLTDATLRLARLAVGDADQDALASALEREFHLEQGVASSLIARLVSAGVLSSQVKASTRLLFSGHSEIARQLRHELSQALWPAELAATEVVVLGTLGSTDWYRLLDAAQRRQTGALTCSFEGAGAWIGPFLASGEASGAPCPLCLQARRVAAGMQDNMAIALSCPPNLSLVAGLVRQVAELSARGELARGQVLHVQGATARWHTLLAQPSCTHCDATESSTFRTLSAQSADCARSLEHALSLPDSVPEPSEPQRRALLDPLLGPLRMEIHEAPGTFRDLPLVLGSIQSSQRSSHGLVRRELSSVMFGTGATERRRLLVAFAEGVERYAGLTDEPDLTAVPYRELVDHAVAPEQTVRFSEAQYASGLAARHTGQPLDWSWVYDWTHGGARLLVHDAVSYGRNPLRSGERLFDDPFSSGMSAHRTAALALERSVLELIERDAFVLAWYLRLPLAELDLSKVADSELRELIGYLEEAGVTLRFHDLRVDFPVPTVLAVARAERDLGPWKKGGVILSACAGNSWRDAARHAVREVLGHYTVFGIVSPDGDKSVEPESGRARPWWAAFAALLAPRADNPLSFLAQGEPLQVEDCGRENLTLLRTELSRRGLSVFVRKLGRADIAESGLIAVRAIIPGLLRLTPTRESVNFGEPRIERVRQRWNAASDLNPLPHPLA